MTRINAGISPRLLTNKHLLAEHREIKRIPNMVSKHGYDPNTIPKQFTLGKGHVKFFYDKLFYLGVRYQQIYAECKLRGFNVTYYGDAFEPEQVNGEKWIPDILEYWIPNEDEGKRMVELVSHRINERLGLPVSSGIQDWHSLIDK